MEASHKVDGGRQAPGRKSRPQVALEALGPLRQRARLGNGARRLQRQRQRVGISAPRSRPLQGLPLERRRHRRDLRPPPAHLLRAGAVEREGPHPEGAHFRAYRQRGQSRRGREGILLLPRQHSHALLHEVSVQVPTGGVPLRATGGGEPPAGQERSRVRTDGHRRVRGRPLLRRCCGVRQGLAGRPAHSHQRHQSRPRAGALAPAADHLVSQYLVVGEGGHQTEAGKRIERASRNGDQH